MNELETILKVLGEKIKSLELTIECDKYTIEKLKKENEKLEERLNKPSYNKDILMGRANNE